jgi:Icc-related predicted phosphoesterase
VILLKIRLFFSSDIHGSEICFKKFISAGKFYKANILILGGDITGKAIIPIVKHENGSFTIKYLGKIFNPSSEEELNKIAGEIRNSGYYIYLCSLKEKEDLENDVDKRDKLFSELMKKNVREWLKLAEEKLKGTGIKCFIMPGNDDRLDIDQVFKESNYIINPEGKVIEINSEYEMISTGYANITPWNCPRDIPEEKLNEKIEEMISSVKNLKNCIFNFHVPPYNSGLDTAPKLDEQFKIKVTAGRPEMEPVGSKAVRSAIEKYQPLLGLHGHIHESKGVHKIGRTLCINPGSEYQEGVLRGAIVDLEKGKIKDFLLTSG